jgi:phage antirepressor YoqD-like protein
VQLANATNSVLSVSWCKGKKIKFKRQQMARRNQHDPNQGLLPFPEWAMAPADTWYTMSEVAAFIDGMGRTKLFEFLRQEAVINMENRPKPVYCAKGYFKVERVPRYYNSGLLNNKFQALRVSSKGVYFIITLIKTKEKENGKSSQ